MPLEFYLNGKTILDCSKMIDDKQHHLGYHYYFKDSHGQYVKIYKVYRYVVIEDKCKVFYYMGELLQDGLEIIYLDNNTPVYEPKPLGKN